MAKMADYLNVRQDAQEVPYHAGKLALVLRHSPFTPPSQYDLYIIDERTRAVIEGPFTHPIGAGFRLQQLRARQAQR